MVDMLMRPYVLSYSILSLRRPDSRPPDDIATVSLEPLCDDCPHERSLHAPGKYTVDEHYFYDSSRKSRGLPTGT